MPDHRLQNRRHRGLLQAGDFGARQHRVGEQGHQHHQRGHADKAKDRGHTHIGTLLRIARIDARPLDADEDERGDEHRSPYLIEDAGCRHALAAPEIRGKQMPFERNREDQDKQDNRQDLGDSDNFVDRRRLLHPAQDREMKGPDADRRDHDRGKRVAIAKDREKRPERRFDQHPVERVAETGAEKIADGGKEPEIVAKPGLGVGIDTGVEVRLTLGEGLEHAGQGIHAAGGDQPGYDRAKNPGGGGEGSRQRPDARPDHRADYHHGQRKQREFLRLLHRRRGCGTVDQSLLALHWNFLPNLAARQPLARAGLVYSQNAPTMVLSSLRIKLSRFGFCMLSVMPPDGVILRNCFGRSSSRTMPCCPCCAWPLSINFFPMQSVHPFTFIVAWLLPGICLSWIAFSEAWTRTPLNGWPGSITIMAPTGTKPSAFCDSSGTVAINSRSRISSEGFPTNVGTSCGPLQSADHVSPVTRTMSSLGSSAVCKTSTPVT